MTLSRALIVSQVSLCMLLLTASSLFVRTLTNLTSLDPGFQPKQLLLFNLDATQSGYAAADQTGFYERVQARLSELPGVQAVTYSSEALLSGSMSNTRIRMAGEPGGNEKLHAHNLRVGARFHSVMGIPLVAGRELSERDSATSPPVAIVNEAFVKEILGGRNPVGQRFHIGTFPGIAEKDPEIEIVGVCKNARYDSLRDDAPSTVYMASVQWPERVRGVTFEVRTASGAGSLIGAIRAAVAELNKNVPLANVRTQEEQIQKRLGMERMFATLVSGFGVTAALLAAIGLYGLMAYAVARRRAEIGIRVALGAGRRQVQWMVVRDSLLMAAIGLGIGIPAALALSDVVRSSLYGVRPKDPVSLAAAGVLMVGVTLAAAWLPSLSAARVDPVQTLRCD